MEQFVETILRQHVGAQAQELFEKSCLLQYLDGKSGAIHGSEKTRRSLGNYYAIYSILYFYAEDFYEKPEAYLQFDGYEYSKLFRFYRGLYGGSKLQNHALNSRVNGEFRNWFHSEKDLIIINDGKYLLHIDYLLIDGYDISLIAKEIIEEYISLLQRKDRSLAQLLDIIRQETQLSKKKKLLDELLTEDAEARLFELISYAILKHHYRNQLVYFGHTPEEVIPYPLELYKTGRTNANDGGIDFVMRPVGRFFQVTEVGQYDKYLLDIDKVLHFPITFVVKTYKSREQLQSEINAYIHDKSGGMLVLKARYERAFEELITINELRTWLDEMSGDAIDSVISDIDFYYSMELNLK